MGVTVRFGQRTPGGGCRRERLPPRVPDETQQIAIAFQQLPFASPSPLRLAIIIENGIVPLKTVSMGRVRRGDTDGSLVVPSSCMGSHVEKGIGNPKVLKPDLDPLSFTKAWNGHALSRLPPDHSSVFGWNPASMRVAFKLQQDNTRVTRQSMDGVLLMPVLQQFRQGNSRRAW